MPEGDKAEAAISVIGAIVGGLIYSLQQTMRDLDELKAELKKQPTIDGSASDAEEAALEADSPE